MPLSEANYNKELEYIKHMAITNGYESSLIDKVIRRRLRRLDQEHTGPTPVKTPSSSWCVIPYCGYLAEKVGEVLEKENVKVAYSKSLSLGSHISRLKDPLDVGDQSGVYKMTCGICKHCYIGQTGRKLKQRCREHMRKSQNSEFRTHLEDAGHAGGTHSVSLLHNAKKGRGLTTLEALEIKLEKAGGLCLNVKTDLVDVGMLALIRPEELLRLPSSSRAALTLPPTTTS